MMSTSPRSQPKPTPAPVETHVDQTQVDLTKPAASTSPSMPHERDEGAGMTGGEPSARVQQGHRDVKRGVQDTTRAPEADTAYRRLKK